MTPDSMTVWPGAALVLRKVMWDVSPKGSVHTHLPRLACSPWPVDLSGPSCRSGWNTCPHGRDADAGMEEPSHWLRALSKS